MAGRTAAAIHRAGRTETLRLRASRLVGFLTGITVGTLSDVRDRCPSIKPNMFPLCMRGCAFIGSGTTSVRAPDTYHGPHRAVVPEPTVSLTYAPTLRRVNRHSNGGFALPATQAAQVDDTVSSQCMPAVSVPNTCAVCGDSSPADSFCRHAPRPSLGACRSIPHDTAHAAEDTTSSLRKFAHARVCSSRCAHVHHIYTHAQAKTSPTVRCCHLPGVVRLRRSGGRIVQGCDATSEGGGRSVGGICPRANGQNPFTVKKSGSVERAVEEFRRYILRRPDLMDRSVTWVARHWGVGAAGAMSRRRTRGTLRKSNGL